MIDSNLRDIPALIYISYREPKGPKAKRGPKPRFNLGSGLPSWPLKRLFDLCSGRITQEYLPLAQTKAAAAHVQRLQQSQRKKSRV